jgi:hypothetical protein
MIAESYDVLAFSEAESKINFEEDFPVAFTAKYRTV